MYKRQNVFDPSTHAGCVNWTERYDANVTGGTYTAMDERAATLNYNDGRRGVGDSWVYGAYYGEYISSEYTIGNWSEWVANAVDLPPYPQYPVCRTCPV